MEQPLIIAVRLQELDVKPRYSCFTESPIRKIENIQDKRGYIRGKVQRSIGPQVERAMNNGLTLARACWLA